EEQAIADPDRRVFVDGLAARVDSEFDLRGIPVGRNAVHGSGVDPCDANRRAAAHVDAVVDDRVQRELMDEREPPVEGAEGDRGRREDHGRRDRQRMHATSAPPHGTSPALRPRARTPGGGVVLSTTVDVRGGLPISWVPVYPSFPAWHWLEFSIG